MKSLKPMGNRVVIKRHSMTQTKGGILLPDTALEKPRSGDVIAVGPGKFNDKGQLIPMHVKLGDKVLFSSFAGSSIDLDQKHDEDILVMSEDDILAIIT